MAWTTPRTWVTGETVTAAQLNTHVRDNLSFLYNPPRVSVTRSTDFTVANATPVNVQFQSELYDTDNMWTSGSNTRLTVNTSGLFSLSGYVVWDASATGERRIANNLNGVIQAQISQMAVSIAATGTRQALSYFVIGTSGQYFELQVYHTAGASLNLIGAGNSITFGATWQAST